MIRRRYYVSGRVQGVGFRYRAYYLAQELGLTGKVQNLEDGRVLLEVQGESSKAEQLLDRLAMGTFISITDIASRDMPLDEGESNFQIM